jgi:hypothetical protein
MCSRMRSKWLSMSDLAPAAETVRAGFGPEAAWSADLTVEAGTNGDHVESSTNSTKGASDCMPIVANGAGGPPSPRSWTRALRLHGVIKAKRSVDSRPWSALERTWMRRLRLESKCFK